MTPSERDRVRSVVAIVLFTVALAIVGSELSALQDAQSEYPPALPLDPLP